MSPDDFKNRIQPLIIANKNFNKIFCIGYNKTGITSLETVLKFYGYKMPNQQQQETRLTFNNYATKYTEFKYFVSQYDAFQDMPFSQDLTFVAMDALFPDSKFILSERDSEAWFNSMVNFTKKIFHIEDMSKLTENDIKIKFDYLFPGYSYSHVERLLSIFKGSKKYVLWDKIFDKEYYINAYEQRNQQIKKYFSGAPHKLLIIDITKEPDTSKICNFLNIPLELTIPMPHKNKT